MVTWTIRIHFLPFSAKKPLNAAKAAGASPILITPIARRLFDADGKFLPGKPLFMWPKDNTHLKPEGAMRMASLLADGLKGSPYADLLAGEDEGADR